MERCETCRFFQSYPEAPEAPRIRGYGMCRKNPPVAVIKETLSPQTVLDCGMSFPYTFIGQWCGEWKEK